MFLAFQTSKTGIPQIGEFSSSYADELTMSLAPTTKTKSVFSKSSLISSISNTISYGIPTSANKTFNYPGILPATGWMANLKLIPLLFNNLAISPIIY